MVADNTDLAPVAADEPAKDRSRMSPPMVKVDMETLGTVIVTLVQLQGVLGEMTEVVVVAEQDPYGPQERRNMEVQT